MAGAAAGEDGGAREVRALGDLGNVQLAAGQLDAAERSYLGALALIETSGGIASPLLVEPLAGLAAVHAARDQHALAADELRRAIAVSRRGHGLFDEAQQPLLERLALSLAALRDREGVLEVRQYLLTMAEQNYGPDDARVLAPLRDLAALYDDIGRHARARMLYDRMRRLGLMEGESGNAVVVEALLGLGASHRREFVDSPTSLYQEWMRDPLSGSQAPQPVLEPYQSPRPRREGPRATERALELLREVESPPPQLLAAALIEAGDWKVVRYKAEAAIAAYAEACRLHDGRQAGAPDPLAQPRLVLYRAPESSRRAADAPPAAVQIQSVRFRLTVDALGRPADVELFETAANERRTELLLRSVEFARYSPRFVDCRPVVTEGVEFVAHWEGIATDDGAAPAGTPADR